MYLTLPDGIRVAQGKRKVATGTLRPDIVLYNENHPFGDAIGKIQSSDLSRSPDVLLVMGTSLKVHGLRLLVRKAAKIVHENKKGCVILVNKTPVVGKEWAGVFDYFVEGETDGWCSIVENAIRQVKVQTKLPFKPLTPAQADAQTQMAKATTEEDAVGEKEVEKEKKKTMVKKASEKKTVERKAAVERKTSETKRTVTRSTAAAETSVVKRKRVQDKENQLPLAFTKKQKATTLARALAAKKV